MGREEAKAADAELRKRLGTALVILRRKSTLKQHEVSARAGITKGMMSAYENGRQFPGIPILVAILRTLDVNFHDLQDALDFATDPEAQARLGERAAEQEMETKLGRSLAGLLEIVVELVAAKKQVEKEGLE